MTPAPKLLPGVLLEEVAGPEADGELVPPELDDVVEVFWADEKFANKELNSFARSASEPVLDWPTVASGIAVDVVATELMLMAVPPLGCWCEGTGKQRANSKNPGIDVKKAFPTVVGSANAAPFRYGPANSTQT